MNGLGSRYLRKARQVCWGCKAAQSEPWPRMAIFQVLATPLVLLFTTLRNRIYMRKSSGHLGCAVDLWLALSPRPHCCFGTKSWSCKGRLLPLSLSVTLSFSDWLGPCHFPAPPPTVLTRSSWQMLPWLWLRRRRRKHPKNPVRKFGGLPLNHASSGAQESLEIETSTLFFVCLLLLFFF